MKTVTEIVTALGGRNYVATALSLTEGAVGKWEREHVIPEARQAEILHLSMIRSAGVTVADLMAVSRRKEPAPRPIAPVRIVTHTRASLDNPPF